MRGQSEDVPGEVSWTLEEFLPGRLIRHWNGLAREAVESRSLDVLKAGRARLAMVGLARCARSRAGFADVGGRFHPDSFWDAVGAAGREGAGSPEPLSAPAASPRPAGAISRRLRVPTACLRRAKWRRRLRGGKKGRAEHGRSPPSFFSFSRRRLGPVPCRPLLRSEPGPQVGVIPAEGLPPGCSPPETARGVFCSRLVLGVFISCLQKR